MRSAMKGTLNVMFGCFPDIICHFFRFEDLHHRSVVKEKSKTNWRMAKKQVPGKEQQHRKVILTV